MYTKSLRDFKLWNYANAKSLLSNYLRYQFPHDYGKVSIKTQFPGPAHMEALANAPYHGEGSHTHRFINFKKSRGNYF